MSDPFSADIAEGCLTADFGEEESLILVGCVGNMQIYDVDLQTRNVSFSRTIQISILPTGLVLYDGNKILVTGLINQNLSLIAKNIDTLEQQTVTSEVQSAVLFRVDAAGSSPSLTPPPSSSSMQ